MNNEEIQALMSQLKNAGLTEEDIADGVLWPLFRDGKMSKEDLTALCASIGLELEEEFEDDKTPAPIEGDKGEGAKDGSSPAPAAGITKEEAEAAKEIKPGESKEEFKEKIEEAKKPDAEGGDEEAEWEEAKKLFKL